MRIRDFSVIATVFAAATIIGSSLAVMRCQRQRRVEHKVQLEAAEQTWEDEGGAIVCRDEDLDGVTR